MNKKTPEIVIPLLPEEYGKLTREAEGILNKKWLFSQRHKVLSNYTRDRYGNLQTAKIQQLR